MKTQKFNNRDHGVLRKGRQKNMNLIAFGSVNHFAFFALNTVAFALKPINADVVNLKVEE